MNKINLSCRSLALFILIAVFGGSNQLVAMDGKKPAETSKEDAKSSSAVAETVTVCPICLLPIDASELVKGQAFFKNCYPRHVFHGRCLARLIITQGALTKCPLCFGQLYNVLKSNAVKDNAAENNESFVGRFVRVHNEGLGLIIIITIGIGILYNVFGIDRSNWTPDDWKRYKDWDTG